MEKKLETLEKVSEEADADENIDILLIHHVLPDIKYIINALDRNYHVEKIIGIPYSTKKNVVESVEEEFDIELRCPNSVEEVTEASRSFIESYQGNKNDLVIMDLGGYCSEFISTIDSDKIRGIVEDTNQGHWKYEERDLEIPIYSIAQGEIKDLENRVVGEAVTFSTERIIRNQFEEGITGKKVLVMGYGGIGKAVARACYGRNAEVMVYDIDAIRMIEAKLDGFVVREKEEMLEEAEVLIGTTGEMSVGKEEMKNLKDGCVLASGSSKQVEFDIDFLKDQNKLSTGSKWDKYDLGDKCVFLLNDGSPVNFLDNSISLSVLDLIFSELFVCVQSLAETNEHEKGVQEVDYQRKQEIAQKWLKINR